MRRLTITHITPACVEFTGWDVRDLHKQVVGRSPVWNTRSRRWVTQPAWVPDLIAAAEVAGYSVQVHDPKLFTAVNSRPPAPAEEPATAPDVSDEALW